jgi:hypothetical protein
LPPRNRDQIGQQRIRRLCEAPLELTDRDLAKQIRLENEGVRFPVDYRQQIGRR